MILFFELLMNILIDIGWSISLKEPNGRIKQKVLKWNYNNVTKVKLDCQNSLWWKWLNAELQKHWFKRKKQ